MTANLGKKLGKLRTERKLSAEAVADKLGTHAINLKKWERAKEWPDRDTLIKLARIYEVPPEELTSIVDLEQAYNASKWRSIPYPTIVFALYLCYGFATGGWHPAWLVLLTIPVYRKIGEYFIGKQINENEPPAL